jgi:hypothetical protein
MLIPVRVYPTDGHSLSLVGSTAVTGHRGWDQIECGSENAKERKRTRGTMTSRR